MVHHVEAVLDIGANTGQFAQVLLADGYQGEILSFEPLEQEHAALCRSAAGHPRWYVHARAALGNSSGTIDMHRAANSVSSSAIPILEAHIHAEPSSRTIGTEIATVLPLDAVSHPVLDRARSFCLKLDTQGYEHQILSGATSFLSTRDVPIIHTEMSLVELYEGQATFLDHLLLMRSLGFEIFHLQPGFTDQTTGQSLQLDAIFLRKTQAAAE